LSDRLPLRQGIFGGTFDPIHIGHVATVRDVMERCNLDQVRYLPASIPPHRSLPGVSAEQRLEMVKIALDDEPAMIIDDQELRREGRSYTFDTVQTLQQQFPQSRFSLILGLDALLGFDRWHRWQELLGLIDIIAMVRPGWQPPDPLPDWWRDEIKHDTPDTVKIKLVDIDPVDISATRIRQGIADGDDMGAFLHPGVWQYIQTHGLYE